MIATPAILLLAPLVADAEFYQSGWKEVADAVHARGGKVFLQIYHMGRASHSSFQAGEQFSSPTFGYILLQPPTNKKNAFYLGGGSAGGRVIQERRCCAGMQQRRFC